MKRFLPLIVLLALAGCSGPDVRQMPIQMITAEQNQAQLTEVLPVTQVLRPEDVLDVIFHLDTTSSEAYRIQAGDHVDLTFLTTTELSGSKVVLPDGTIDVPYVGSLDIAGLTVPQAQSLLVKRYSAVLRNPEIIFSVTQPMAQIEQLRMTLMHPYSGMSRDITVGADGRASFPLIGSLTLQGMSVDELRETLNERYAKEVGQIRTDVILKSTLSNQVFVLGEVAQPGAYPIRRPVSVLEALTLARGASPKARLDSVVIVHRQGNQAEVRIYDADKALNGKALQFAYLQPDDLLYVPQTRLSRAGELSRQLADVILFNGAGLSFSYRVDDKEDSYRAEP